MIITESWNALAAVESQDRRGSSGGARHEWLGSRMLVNLGLVGNSETRTPDRRLSANGWGGAARPAKNGGAGVVESQPKRKQRRPVRTRAPQVDLTDSEVLRHGLDFFSDLGYAGGSVREFAKRLGVNHNFINDRFGSKHNFWQAVVDYALEDLRAPLAVAFEVDADDAEKLEMVVRTFYSVAANVPQMNRILAAECVLNSERVDYIYSKYTASLLERVEPIAERLMESGRMPRIPIDVLFTALSGPALALTQSEIARRLGRAPQPSAAEWEQLTDCLTELVLRGLLPVKSGADSITG
ncbi:TetR/AcrR family transcriptional regulator [Micromonospora sp. NPDC005367]|uniref:TetR/AcrR family transcriptional regulator n=1 Tax=Micromonospora sp. NPDC005367 TaxID=3155590 RepID=UPI0033BA5BAD